MKTLAKIGRARALYRYFRDPDASVIGKVFVLFALAYAVSPVDAIPDIVPVVGWLDDIGVMGLATAWMWRVVGRYRDASVRSESEPAQDAPSAAKKDSGRRASILV